MIVRECVDSGSPHPNGLHDRQDEPLTAFPPAATCRDPSPTVTDAHPTHLLSRTVRLAVGPHSGAATASGNGLVSAVASLGLEPIVEFEVCCAGGPDESGYLVDIGVIDRAVRTRVAPIVLRALRDLFTMDEVALRDPPACARAADPSTLLAEALAALESALPAPVHSLTYRTSPFRSATIERGRAAERQTHRGTTMPDGATTHAAEPARRCVLLSETFEFAASHRLHIPSLGDDANRALFGKCNNPNGHGHNYRIEVAVEVSVGIRGEVSGDGSSERGRDGAAARFGFAELEDAVGCEVMARFDHKHLNLDCPEFRDLNPSVEHIARVCHDLLAPAIAARGGALRFVRVWETEKTSCRYPA
jgi:6-pyruvoyltetrahydropterin/6-carboxytetrahydropterin synthase